MTRLRRRAFAFFALLSFCWPSAAVLAQETKAGVVTNLQGNVTAKRVALPQPVPLKFKDDVFLNDRVVTGERSTARLLLGGAAVVTIRERSALTITEIPGKSTIDLDSGKIAVAVARERMKRGQSLEVKTPNAIAGVRGTAFVVEVERTTASLDAAQGGVTTHFYGFAGQILVTVANRVHTLLENAFLTAMGLQPPSVGPMTPDIRARALAGLQIGASEVAGGQQGAKNQAVGMTVALVVGGFALGGEAEVPIVSAPTCCPPPPILPGGADDISVSSGGAGGGGGGVGGVLTPDTFTPTQGDVILFNPVVSPAFGTVAPNGVITDQYKAAGVMFGPATVGIFCDCPNAWGGVNSNNVVDLISPVEAFFVTPGTTLGAKTKHLSVEAGFSAVGSLLLEAFDSAGRLIGSTLNDDGTGPHRRTLATLDFSDPIIAAFRLSGNDTWGMDQIAFGDLVDPPALITLSEPLLRVVNEQRQAYTTFVDTVDATIVGESTDPFIWLSGSTMTTAHRFALIRGSDITAAGSFVRLDDGSAIVQTATAEPLIALRGGSLRVGTGGAGHLFELYGRPNAVQVDSETGLTLGTDRPLQPGPESPLFEASNGATVTVRGSAYRVDAALLEATAPLLHLVTAALTTGDSAVDLFNGAKVSLPSDAVAMIRLNAASLTVATGNLVNVSGGSVLNVGGSLVSLSNGSLLNILNGLLLNVSGGSAVTIGKSLVSFGGTGNVLSISNQFRPTALIGGIPVHGPADAFRIGGNALAGVGSAGTVYINGVALTSTTPLANLSGSLIAIQDGGTVKIGP